MNYLRVSNVAKKLDVSKATIYRFVRKGLLPPPIKLSTGTSVWPVSDINAFIEKMRGES